MNLTDGLDGLAILPASMVGVRPRHLCLCHGGFAGSQNISSCRTSRCRGVVDFLFGHGGAGLAFLWFNAHPAQVFMGDVGALALGAALGTVAVIVRQEIVLAISGWHLRGGSTVGDDAGGLFQVHQTQVRGGTAHFGGWLQSSIIISRRVELERNAKWLCVSGSSRCCCAWSGCPH
ncbi:MAG: hypothetical protein MZW92_43970 [Comamonadaceae bacterium]|nr:hypothetical protein [Comamonadaceae bacterium]